MNETYACWLCHEEDFVLVAAGFESPEGENILLCAECARSVGEELLRLATLAAIAEKEEEG